LNSAWYAAFGLLALLCVANAILLVAVMRQVGIIHLRVPETLTGAVGPEPGASFRHLDLLPVPGGSADGVSNAPVTVIAYVRPDCDLCEEVPKLLETYQNTASADELALVSFVLATDASEADAERFRAQHAATLPFGRHPDLKEHYGLQATPYLFALARSEDGEPEQVLAGGVINTVDHLEDLVEAVIDQRSVEIGDARGPGAKHDGPDRDGAGSAENQLTVIGGN
jgi:hypothetical protein